MASRRTAGDGVRDKRRAPAGSRAADARLVAAAALEAAALIVPWLAASRAWR